jgi:hypothetical protein
MRVRLLTTRATLQRRYEIGEEIDVPSREATLLIERGQAEPVRAIKPERRPQERPRERAVAVAPREQR